MDGRPGGETVRLAELMAAWSVAIDVAMAHPLETGLRVCLLATRIARQAGADADELHRTFYLALLRHIGCTAGNAEFAAVVGDERAFREGIGGLDVTSTRELLPYMLRVAVGSRPPAGRPAALVHFVAGARALPGAATAVCEVARILADRLGFGPGLKRDLGQVYERHDGRGFPNRLPGDAVSLPAQAVQVAEATVIHKRLGGRDGVLAMLAQRRGRAMRPDLVDIMTTQAGDLLAEPGGSLWDSVIDAEPGAAPLLDGPALDDALRALADFVDLKSAYTVGHSTDVARLAGDAGRACVYPDGEVSRLRRAGWVHDLGRLSVSVTVWDKPAALTRDEWERVRLHAYYTERILTRPRQLADIVALAGAHHERLDATGYPKGQPASALTPGARILAAADVYVALVNARPHRPALPAPQAARTLREEAAAGRLDAEAVDAVLYAAGHPARRKRSNVAGLTAREVEVLGLLSRGRSTRQIATDMGLSPRTVGHHVESIYGKAGVSTRAAATMFAMQHGLVDVRAPDTAHA